MGYRRRRRYKRKRYRRKRFYKRKRWRFNAGKVALRMVRSVKRAVGKIEYKWQEMMGSDQIGYTNGVAPMWIINKFCLIGPEGVEQDERIGKIVTIQSFRLRINLKAPSSMTNPSEIRFLLVLFPNNGGGDPNLDQVLTDTTTNVQALVSTYTKKATDGAAQDLYKVLIDRVCVLPIVSGGSGSKMMTISYKFKKGLVVSYRGDTNPPVVADINKNYLKLFVFSTSAVSWPLATWQYRLYYTDV